MYTCLHVDMYGGIHHVSDPQLKFGGLVRSVRQTSTPQVKPLSTHNIAVSRRGSRNNVSKRSASVVDVDARMLPKSLSNLDTVMWKGKYTTREGDYQTKSFGRTPGQVGSEMVTALPKRSSPI